MTWLGLALGLQRTPGTRGTKDGAWGHRWPIALHDEVVKVLVFNRVRRLIGLPMSLEWRA